jgi:CDGSH-type Zn-finger protein
MSDVSSEPTITVTVNGPYLVSGALPLSEQAIGIDPEGNAWTWEGEPGGDATAPRESYALCRCGQSQNKPFCDGSHARTGFDGAETASREPYEAAAEVIDGPSMVLHDDQPLCAFARFCDGYGSIWERVTETEDERTRELVAHQGSHCPSGRLVVRDKEADGAPVEPDFEPSVVLVEDPQQNASGPIWVRGGVQVVAADGHEYEVRNRVTLCRCGQSTNKPFCDGTHAHVGFRAHE